MDYDSCPTYLVHAQEFTKDQIDALIEEGIAVFLPAYREEHRKNRHAWALRDIAEFQNEAVGGNRRGKKRGNAASVMVDYVRERYLEESVVDYGDLFYQTIAWLKTEKGFATMECTVFHERDVQSVVAKYDPIPLDQ